jgi:hypothetical protein
VNLDQRVDCRKIRYSGRIDCDAAGRVFEKQHLRIGVGIRGYAPKANRCTGARHAVRQLGRAGDFK